MNMKVCPKCGKENAPQMNFCSDCGQGLPSGGAPTGRIDEPPPTVFMGQQPPQSPFGQTPSSSNAPNNPFGQSQQNQQTPSNNPFGQSQQNQAPPNNNPFGQPSNNPQFSTPAPPAQPPKKGGKGMIFAAVGCLGLLVLGLVGAVIGGVLLYGGSNTAQNPTPTPFTNTSTPSNSAKNTSSSPSNNTSSDNTSSDNTSGDPPSSNLLTMILESRKTVGSFNQTAVKSVTTSDYFPEGTGAAQATYSNGSKFVYLTVGQFVSMDNAKKNFNDQLKGVKSNGGKVTYQNTASDGTISAIYESRGYYFAEYCNTNNFCNRIHSDDREALKSFFGSYAKK